MKRRGVVDPVTLGVVAVVAIGALLFGGWKPLQFLKPKPPTEELTKLQEQLAKAQADKAQAEKDKDAATEAERKALLAQFQSTYESNAAAEYILKKIDAAHTSPQSSLGTSMVVRTNKRFAVIMGPLPEDVLKDIASMMDGIIAERDEALAKLAQSDRKFEQLTGEHQATVQALQEATKREEDKTAKLATVQVAVTEKTNEVKAKADALDAESRKAGSLAGSLTQIWHGILWVAGIYVFLAFILPGIVKHMDSGPLKNGLRSVSGYLTNPVLFHDARKKLAALNQKSPNPPAT